MFVSFEGIDGCGKTTQVELLEAYLEMHDVEVVATREPGGTPLGERLREIVLHGEHVSPWAEAALFAASRAELVAKVIRPALGRGAAVICDRYVDSSLAYQGLARSLGLQQVYELNLHAIEGLLPERTFLLLIPPEVSLQRVGDERDRIESEDMQFRRRVDAAYRRLAQEFPHRIVPIDGMQPPETIARLVHASLEDVWVR